MRTSGNQSSVNQQKIALLIIDVQNGLFRKPVPIYQADKLIKNINTLVDRAHQAGAPVFYVQHSGKKMLAIGSDDWQLHPKLHPLDRDFIVPKSHGNAFEDTILEQELNSKRIESVVVTGLVTHACVRMTCIGAKRLGYGVILVLDGHSNYCKHAARVIAEWNRKLGTETVEVKLASDMEFD